MGLLKMLWLVRLSEHKEACKACERVAENAELLKVDAIQRKRIVDLVEQNDRLAAKVSELSEALERRGHPLSWPTITDPDEPSTVSTLAVDIDPRFAAAAYEHDLKVAGHG